jgi:acyl carrier protein phosphodiesterase
MSIFDLNHSDTTLDSEDSTKIKQAFAYLIEIGKSNDPAKADALQKIHDLSRGQPTFVGGVPRFLLGHPRFYHEIKSQDLVESLAIVELAALIKGYAFCEERFRWSGGSVSPAIEMFRILNKRGDPKVADEVADWILSRKINECLPYGVNKRGAQSAKEFRKISSERLASYRQSLAEETELARQRTIDRARRKAQRFASARDRNSYIREKLKDDLSHLAVGDQLQRLIDDQEYSVEFYPTCLAGATTHDVITSLNANSKLAVLERLKGKHRGPWGGLKKRLLVSMGLYEI